MSSSKTAPRAFMKITSNNENSRIFKQVLRSYASLLLVALFLIPTLIFLSSSVVEQPLTQTIFTALPKESSKILLPSGDYKLTENIASTSTINISGDVHIDLAGKSFTASLTNTALFEINTGGSLTISDSVGGGTVSNSNNCVYIIAGSFTLNSGALSTINLTKNCVYISAGATCTINGGSISSSSPTTPAVINQGDFYYVGGSVLSGASVDNAISGTGKVYDTLPNGTIDIEINTEYPDVNYSINFPVIDALTMQRSETENVEETEFSLFVNKAENLFDEREIVLEFNSDFLFSNSSNSNTFPFELQIGGLSSGESGTPVGIVLENSGQNIPYDGKISVDTQDIPSKGTYTAQITYSVVVREK